jgi:hypothetical protein
VRGPGAGELKAEALSWLRFIKGYHIVCTEVGRWNSDVLGLSAEDSVEIEVKVTKSDLKAEFKNKRDKHTRYFANDLNRDNADTKGIPSYFYIMMPEHLIDEALPIVAVECPKAGVLKYSGDLRQYGGLNTSVVRRATRIHSKPPTKGTVNTAIRRMSSELCGVHKLVEVLVADFNDHIHARMDEVIETVRLREGPLDLEQTNASNLPSGLYGD